ncbi:MAG: nucleotidyltransferase family protein [Proteobacteria bacterium]|nr:nucleotidyltransferase family protein [Pseudomonadota bacterium]
MNFRSILSILIEKFKENEVRYALMGGLAFGLWGVGRSTVDIDFLVDRDDLSKIDRVMQELGYECKFKSENVSQYVSPLKIYGEVDFLHAFREASLEMLKRTIEMDILEGSLKIKVLKPEDLIGLKFQAIKNNPLREQTDIEDIKALLSILGGNLDWSEIEEYAKIFDMMDVYKKIRMGK